MKKSSWRWTYKVLILSICLSVVFSIVSQSLFPALPITLSVFIIFFFIAVSVIFDMVAVAITSLELDKLELHKDEKHYKTVLKLFLNREKVSSFCGDVVGDICGILSGAGGVSLVLNMHISDPSIDFLVTCLVSSLIAGITIFGKAIMKSYSVTNCESVVFNTAKLLNSSPLAIFKIFKRRKSKLKDVSKDETNKNH